MVETFVSFVHENSVLSVCNVSANGFIRADHCNFTARV